MIKAVILDLNGVFIKSPRLSDGFSEKFNVPKDDFLIALKSVMAMARLPNAGDSFELWKAYLDKWGLSLSKEDFFDFWFTSESEVSDMINLAGELKHRKIKIFIVSNNFKERTDYYDKTFPFIKEIAEKVYYSWQTGLLKPDEKAYKLILTENNLAPEECLYFDDSEENVNVASRLGIKSFIFKSSEDVRSKCSI
ncbi:MAG: HAD-IA family hydrolase [Candidatus Vogelbacteria bacterium]|nr:HAD-IA family hydrolase [Candidatus Vogelbacteria bacterium]